MKKIIPIILLVSFFCSSQTIEVKYYENLKTANELEFKLLPQNVQIAYKPNLYSYLLKTNSETSLYENEKNNLFINEEINEQISINEFGDTIKSFTTSSGIDLKTKEKIYYKDFNNNKSYNEQFYDEKISILDSLVVFNWVLNEETEIILGYKCKKAVVKDHGSEFHAWYTEEIPIADGPFIFSGLPGLILKVSSKSLDIVAYEIKVKKEPLIIEAPKLSGKIFNYKTVIEYIKQKNSK